MDSDHPRKAVIAVWVALFGIGHGVWAWRRCKERQQKQQKQDARVQLISVLKEKIRAMGSDVKVLTDAEEEEAARVMVASFGGTETTAAEQCSSAYLGPKLAKWNNPARLAWFEVCMLRMLKCAMSPGDSVAIGILSKDKTLGAVCIAKPHTDKTGSHRTDPVLLPVWADPKCDEYQKPRATQLQALREELGEAEAETEKQLREARGKAYHGMCNKLHETYAPGPHLYVQAMAVDPPYQRQGLAQRALGVISELGDELGVPCYLECAGERNKLVYEKAGYETAGGRGFEMNHPGVEDPPRDEFNGNAITRVYGMVRPPKR